MQGESFEEERRDGRDGDTEDAGKQEYRRRDPKMCSHAGGETSVAGPEGPAPVRSGYALMSALVVVGARRDVIELLDDWLDRVIARIVIQSAETS